MALRRLVMRMKGFYSERTTGEEWSIPRREMQKRVSEKPSRSLTPLPPAQPTLPDSSSAPVLEEDSRAAPCRCVSPDQAFSAPRFRTSSRQSHTSADHGARKSDARDDCCASLRQRSAAPPTKLFVERSLVVNRREPHMCVTEFTIQVACRPTTVRRKIPHSRNGHPPTAKRITPSTIIGT